MIKWIATFIILWFIYQVREVFPPIIVGGILAYLLLPVVQWLSKSTRIPHSMSTLIIYFIAAIGLGTLAWSFLPTVFRELTELANQKEAIIKNVVQQVAVVSHWTGDVDATTRHIVENMSESVGTPSEIANIGREVSHGALSVLVCVVSSIYLTLDSQRVGAFFLQYLPKGRREEAVVLAGQMNKLLSNYVRGQLFLIALMSCVAWVFLHFVMNMKYALPVAVISGFLEIIPVLGPILAISTAVIVGIWQIGPSSALIIIGFYTIARWIEDYVVVPKVIGHAVELHPLGVIFAVLCGEKLAGALGMLIAIPVAACIKLFIDFFYFGHDPTNYPVEPKTGPRSHPTGPLARPINNQIKREEEQVAKIESELIPPAVEQPVVIKIKQETPELEKT